MRSSRTSRRIRTAAAGAVAAAAMVAALCGAAPTATVTGPGGGGPQATPQSPAAAAAVDSGNPAEVLSVLFPADQLAAARAYGLAITRYPGYYQAPVAVRTAEESAIQQWMTGADPAGRAPGADPRTGAGR